MAAVVTVFAVGEGNSSTGSLTLTPPAGDFTGMKVITQIGCAGGTAIITPPASVDLLKQGDQSSHAFFVRDGTASEPTQTYTFGTNTARHAGHIFVLSSTTGFPASLVDFLADSDALANGSGDPGNQHYGELTITEENTWCIQGACRNINTGNITPNTSPVAVTSGWTSCGSAISNATNGGLILSAQFKDTSPTIAGDVSQNSVAIQNSDNLARRYITFCIRANPDVGEFAYDASYRDEVPRTAFPAALFSGWVFEAGDTYEIYDQDPADAVVVPHDGGAIDITDFAGADAVTVRFIINKLATGVYTDWEVTYPAPETIRDFTSASGVFTLTGDATPQVTQFRSASGTFVLSGVAFGELSGGRDIPFSGNLNDAYILPVIFASLEFDSGTMYIHNDLGTITTLGHDWLGVGTFGDIAPIEEREDHSPTGTTLSLSGIDPTLLENVLVESYQGRPVTIYIGIRDVTTGALVSAPMELFAGEMDQMTIVRGGETATIQMAIESEMIDFEKSLMRFFSDAEQQRRYPGDLGMQYLTDMVNARITIGAKTLHTFGQASGQTTAGPPLGNRGSRG